jgi:hypothetical protein
MSLRLNGSTSGYSEIDAPAIAGNNTLVLPTTNGAANQLLKNGSTPGVLEYALTTLDSSGNLGSVASINGGPLAGTRNRIINGDMRIDQRFAGTAATFGAATAYVLDRWQGSATIASNMQFQQVSDAPVGFTSSHKVTALTGATITSSDYFVLIQNIEGLNTSDLGFGAAGAESVTLSFWVKSSVTGTHSGSLRNDAQNRSYPFTYSISSANTWEKKTTTIAGDTTGTWLTTNGIGLSVIFDLGSGSSFRGTAGSWSASNFVGATSSVSPMATSSATWLLTGVQLEAGTVATPFERRSYGQELVLSQRYCQRFDVFPSSSFAAFVSYYGGTNAVHPVQRLTTPMRATPTASFANAGVEYYSYGGYWNGTTLLVSTTSSDVYYIYCATDGDGRGKLLRNGGSGLNPNPIITFTAEL